MAQQLHKRFSNQEVKEVLVKYEKKILALEEVVRFLRIKERRFFILLKKYRKDPDGFSIGFKREKATRGIDRRSEKKIISELKKEVALIEDKTNPVRFFNYSYLKGILEEKHGVVVSLPTIISRAKKMGIMRKGKSGRSMIEKY